jgi:predicted unusual protein kinase regulating ubiquinone biosynthesis (AarF/ABC1/UbiB family)
LGAKRPSQVHKARLRSDFDASSSARTAEGTAGRVVAVKVQFPDVERKMRADFRNLEALAAFLERTELRFDLTSALGEVRDPETCRGRHVVVRRSSEARPAQPAG